MNLNPKQATALEAEKKNCPDDCIVVKVHEDLSQFTVQTWHGRPGEVKTMPRDIYALCKEKVDILWEPHTHTPTPPPEAPANAGPTAKKGPK